MHYDCGRVRETTLWYGLRGGHDVTGKSTQLECVELVEGPRRCDSRVLRRRVGNAGARIESGDDIHIPQSEPGDPGLGGSTNDRDDEEKVWGDSRPATRQGSATNDSERAPERRA